MDHPSNATLPSSTKAESGDQRPESFMTKLNAQWHKPAMQFFAVIVLAHWAEHLVQAFQIYVLDWPIPESRGILGLYFPWMVKSEMLHYGYAIVMLIGIWMLRSGMVGRSSTWWMISFWIQFWHHIEHALLQGQALVGHNLFDSPVPMSLVQLWIPRVELHLFYNSVVFIPMVIGMYYHLFPPPGEEAHGTGCNCAWTPKAAKGKV
tara:strand:+ start:6471 stop:7088 length:618 start_codon:yes stop_codon:yes gene_type:complete